MTHIVVWCVHIVVVCVDISGGGGGGEGSTAEARREREPQSSSLHELYGVCIPERWGTSLRQCISCLGYAGHAYPRGVGG